MHQAPSLLFALACCEFKNKSQVGSPELEPFGVLVLGQRGLPQLAAEPWLCPVPVLCPLGQEESFLLQRADRNNHAIPTRGPSSLCCLLRCSLPLALDPVLSCVPTLVASLAVAFWAGDYCTVADGQDLSPPWKIVLLSLYNLMDISSQKLSAFLSDFSMMKDLKKGTSHKSNISKWPAKKSRLILTWMLFPFSVYAVSVLEVCGREG